jgi:hypothetical protein
MSRRINQQVLGLQITVNDVLLVEVLESEDEVGGVEAGDVGGEPTRTSEVGEEFAALHVFEEEVEVGFVLESAEAASRAGERQAHSATTHFCNDGMQKSV